jgi:hypothetical protein
VSETQPKPETPSIKKPSPARLSIIGGCIAASAILWTVALLLAAHSETGALPRVTLHLIVVAGSASLIIAVVLTCTYLSQHASAYNLGIVLEAVGQVARQQEQVSAKIDKIDPMTIYAAVAGDLLNQDRRP